MCLCVPRSSTRRTGVSRWRIFPPRCFTTYLGGVFQWLQLGGFLNCASKESIAKIGNTGFHNPSQVFSIAICAQFFSIAKRFFFRKHALLRGVKTKFCDAPTDIPQSWRGSVANCIDLVVSYRRRIGGFFSLNHVNNQHVETAIR